MTASERVPERVVSASAVVFDSWAWWEVFHATPAGKALDRKYLGDKRVVVTPTLAIAELSAKLHRVGRRNEGERIAAWIGAYGRTQVLDEEAATHAGRLLEHLREGHRDASLADAIMLATARTLGLPLISADAAFAGTPDVRRE